MPPLMMSVFPYFFELTIQNLLTKDYLYTNGRFVLNLTNGASETSNAAMELKRAYNATLAHLLASKQKKKRNRLYNHTLFGNFFSKFYPDNLATVPQKLLELGSNVKQTDADGNTALHAACSHGQMKIISTISSCGGIYPPSVANAGDLLEQYLKVILLAESQRRSLSMSYL